MTRLYVPLSLVGESSYELDEGQSHYLRHVMRAPLGYKLTVFNERDGAWEAIITTLAKKTITITTQNYICDPVLTPNVSLMFALIKNDPLSFLGEKATELGVRDFYPILTQRCNVSRLNADRLSRTITDATEQCERFDVPKIHGLLPLDKALATWSKDRPLFVCQERADSVPSIGEALSKLSPLVELGFLVGPEGGFSPQEITLLAQYPFVQFISLGPRILRAETAALAALTCYQAMVGDWGRG